MPSDERIRILRAKKRKTQADPPASEEPQVPLTETDPPPTTPAEIVVSDEEPEEQVERSLKLSRKRQPTSSDFRPEASESPTLWPESEENFPFELYNSFVRNTDDHRFGNNSIMDLLNEGMKYQARVSLTYPFTYRPINFELID